MKCETIKYNDNKEVTIIDGSVNIKSIIDNYFLCCAMGYKISNASSTEVQGIVDRRLKCDIDTNHPIIENLLKEKSSSRQTIRKYIPSERYGFCRAYINLGIHGDVNQMHIDGNIDCKTILYYANKHWEYNWGGNTIFYDENGNSKVNVEVKPGRMVIFDGAIPHTVMPMNPRCSPSYRFTVALKFEDSTQDKFKNNNPKLG